MIHFVNKKISLRKPFKHIAHNKVSYVEEENKPIKKEDLVMTTQEKINAVESILATPTVKKIKKDKGLIERTESSAIILTEDNKELLKD